MTAQEAAVRPPNRLIHETSPYLRQHAYNPVDWYPWGEEAFERAQREDRPIFLSVGYSACHWCHVMAHESFEDPTIARMLNEGFVCIKVDREERPDVDQTYQVVCQTLTGQGGWPLTVVLTPDGEPFYAGTYFPPAPRYGRPGLPQVIEACAKAYRERRDQVRQQAAELARAVRRGLDPWDAGAAEGAEAGDRAVSGQGARAGRGGAGQGARVGERGGAGKVRRRVQPGARALVHAVEQLLQEADSHAGGFGRAPKFPHPTALELLFRAAWRFGHQEALAHLERTLVHMVRGGVFDQVGGGFHRYAVDRWWKVPHFEKMLYDNAQLVPLLVRVGTWRRHPDLLQAATQTLDFLLDEMRLPGGGFAASLDADSPDEQGRPAEGFFYRWNPQALARALGDAGDAARIARELAMRSGDATLDRALTEQLERLARDAPPGWVEEALTVPGRLPATGRSSVAPPVGDAPSGGGDSRAGTGDDARSGGGEAPAGTGDEAYTDEGLRNALARMAAFRREWRRPPAHDDKVLAGWHALTLSALVWGFRAGLGAPPHRYLDAAREGFTFIEERLVDPPAGLLHTPRQGAAAIPAYCDDYAFVIHAALDLFTVTQDKAYLQRAGELAAAARERFRGSGGLYFLSSDDHASPLGRPRDVWDQATPSANAAMASAHARLGAVLDAPDHLHAGMEIIEAAWPIMLGHVFGTAGLWCALELLDGGTATVTLRSPDLDAIRTQLRRLLGVPHPGLQARWEMAGDEPSYLVCVGATCDPPRSTVDSVLSRLWPHVNAVTRP